MREQNSARRTQVREGLNAGDERVLPTRDRGPERRMVRDVVDARRNAGGLFLLIAFFVFAGYLVPNLRVRALTVSLWLVVFVMMLVDSIFLGIRIRRLTHERFPNTSARTGGLVWYGISRATMIRRWRVPKPQVNIGDRI